MMPFGDRRVLHYLDLLWVLVGREMKILYKRSVMGVLWTLITPLLQLLTFVLIFRLVLAIEVAHYASYVLTGLLVWQWLQKSTLQATGTIIGNRALIRQPGFPVSVLPVAVAVTGLIHFVLALPVLLGFLVVDRANLGIALVWLPLLMAIQLGVVVAASYLLAGLNVAFRDTQHILTSLLQVLFYLTPVFYSIERIPAEYRDLYALNPMVPLLTGYRQILIEGRPPSWESLLPVVVLVLLLLPLSYRVFARQSQRFVEEI